MWLQGGVLAVVGLGRHVHHDIRLLQPPFDISRAGDHVGRGVAVGVPYVEGIILVVNHRRSIGDGLVDGQDRLQDLVVDRDQADSSSRQLERVGRDRRHAVPHPTHLGVEHAGVVGRRLRITLAGSGVPLVGGVPMIEDDGDAFYLLGRSRVDRLDARMGVGTGEQGHMQQSGTFREIVDENGFPGDQAPTVDPVRRDPDDVELVSHRQLLR